MKEREPPRTHRRASRAFRMICRHCRRWRALNAQEQRAQGRAAFLPAHKRPEPEEAPEPSDDPFLDDDSEPCQDTPFGDEPDRPELPADPLRDYAYWLEHERAQKKRTP